MQMNKELPTVRPVDMIITPPETESEAIDRFRGLLAYWLQQNMSEDLAEHIMVKLDSL